MVWIPDAGSRGIRNGPLTPVAFPEFPLSVTISPSPGGLASVSMQTGATGATPAGAISLVVEAVTGSLTVTGTSGSYTLIAGSDRAKIEFRPPAGYSLASLAIADVSGGSWIWTALVPV